MSGVIRSWAGPSDTDAMQRLASRCWPNGLHPGGLGWSQATNQLADEVVVVDEPVDHEVAGWAGISQPGHLVIQVAPNRPDVTEILVGWLLDTSSGPDRVVDTYDADTRAALVGHGFEPVDPPFGYFRMGHPGLQSPVGALSAAAPSGYTIRGLNTDEVDERVEVHRVAWRPADLPFNPDQCPDFDAASTSSFSGNKFHRVERTALYDRGLDLVVVAPDGQLAGSCIGWFDQATGWVEIEPLGVVPAHRRRGLALALCAEVAARTARLGGHHVFINTAASDFYPAPHNAYTKAGFTPFVRSVTLSGHQG